MHIKGERWLLWDGREVIVTWDLPNDLVRVINDHGMLEVISESALRQRK